MSSISFPCVHGLPALLLAEPQTAHSLRAAQLSQGYFCVTYTDCAQDIFQMRNFLRVTVAVLSDELGTVALRAAAESVRRQWPDARILILGRVPATMQDHLYDQVALHSVDEGTLLSTIDRLVEDPWKQATGLFPVATPSASVTIPSLYAGELRESDPTKLLDTSSHGLHERDRPSGQYRSHRRSYYAFPPSS